MNAPSHRELEPSEIKDGIFVFVSHDHSDHFNPVILSWKEQIPNIHYFLSFDIPRNTMVNGQCSKYNEIYRDENLRIQTFKPPMKVSHF